MNKSLKQSNQIKDKLFSILGHDLRNPIGGITQLLAMMEASELPAEQRRQMITAMRKQGDATLDILNTLLQWGHAQLKGIDIQPEQFNPKPVIRKNTEALLQQAASKSVTVEDQTQAGFELFGDPNHFDFVLRNLLSNAIKLSHPAGSIEISAQASSDAKEVVFAVKDYGKGISPQQQALFSRANLDVTFGTKGEKGTGIGLLLSKEFIKANHGRLWLSSEEGNGATFYFSFPSSGTPPVEDHLVRVKWMKKPRVHAGKV